MRSSRPLGALLGSLVVLTVLSSGAVAQSSSVHDVSQGWSRAETTGSANWADPGVNDSLWPVTSLGASWRDQGLQGFSGIVWYRKRLTVDLPADGSIPRLGILVGPLTYGAWTLYADGVAVGGLGSDAEPLPFPRARSVELPEGSLRDGAVVLALRVRRTAWAADQAGPGWPVSGAVLSGPPNVLELRRAATLMAQQDASLAGLLFATVAILFGAYHLLLWGARHGATAPLWFGLASIAFGINALAFSPWTSPSFQGLGTAYRISSISGHLAAALLLLFLWRTLDHKPGRVVGTYILSHGLLAAALLLMPLHWVVSTEEARFLWLLPGLIFALGLLGLELRDGHPDARILAVGAVAVAAAEAAEILRSAGADLPTYLPFVGFTVALFAVAGMLVSRYARERQELVDLRTALEVRVDERTADLREATDQAQRANEAKSRFLANMSHELRTPLNAVIGFANIVHKRALRTGGVLRDPEMDFLDRIRSNGAHLLTLVDRLLDLTRIEAGIVDLDYTEVEVGPLVSKLLAEMSPQADKRSVGLSAVIPANLHPLRTDATRLKQVLLNLVDNALSFTDKGSVTVRVEAADAQVLAIEVADTGPGIPPERLHELMGIFAQGDDTPARKHQGLGLGLAIAHNLCKLMGFELSLRSTPGHGTVARVQIQPDPSPSPQRSIGARTRFPHSVQDPS